MQFNQSVQYLEADMILQGGHFEQDNKFVPSSAQTSIDAPQVAAMQTQVSISESIGEEGGQVEMGEEEEVEWGKVMKIGMVTTGQGKHYVSDNHKYIEQNHDATNLLTVEGSFIDASSNHLVMSVDGLVSQVNCVFGDTGEQLENMGNIVTSTATNEQGQQIIETFSTSPSVKKEGPAVDEKKTRDDRLNVIAAEILSEYRSKLKNKGKPKKNCDDQKKTFNKTFLS